MAAGTGTAGGCGVATEHGQFISFCRSEKGCVKDSGVKSQQNTRTVKENPLESEGGSVHESRVHQRLA
jgi:hypothetical protein